MKNKLSVLALVLSVVALGSTYLLKHGDQAAPQTQVKESTYDRIMRTKTIRCAYLVWPPFATKDPATGKLGGVYYDLMERIGKDWGVKIEWTEEVGAGNRFEGFMTNRYDMICAPTAATPERTAVSDFSLSLGYMPFYLFTRPDETRFDNAYDKANDTAVTMVTVDGYMAATIVKNEFPNAKLSLLPGLSTDSEVLLSVQLGKADAAVCENTLASDYLKNNEGKIKRVPGPPLRISPLSIPFPLHEPDLRTKLNTTLQYYLDTGVFDKILMAHNMDPDKVLRVAKPYR